MSLAIPTFVSGTVISASDIRDKIQSIENYVNKDIGAADLKTSSKWVESSHIFKPDFFGSPSPRCEAVSGDTWYRHAGLGSGNFAIFHADPVVEQWIPVQGLSATIRNPLNSSVYADVMACFYAFTFAGSDASLYDFNEQQSALFALFSGETEIAGTRREIFASPNQGPFSFAGVGGGNRATRNNLSLFGRVTIAPGTTSISVRIFLDRVTYDGGSTEYDTGGTSEPDWKHTFVGARSLIIDAFHLHA